jgi:hypothetical protein
MRGRRPVVATSEAIAGIALTPEAHVLVGDTPATFAAQCVRLMEAPSLAERIARAAREVYVRDHRPAVMGRVISAAAADFAARPLADVARPGTCPWIEASVDRLASLLRTPLALSESPR